MCSGPVAPAKQRPPKVSTMSPNADRRPPATVPPARPCGMNGSCGQESRVHRLSTRPTLYTQIDRGRQAERRAAVRSLARSRCRMIVQQALCQHPRVIVAARQVLAWPTQANHHHPGWRGHTRPLHRRRDHILIRHLRDDRCRLFRSPTLQTPAIRARRVGRFIPAVQCDEHGGLIRGGHNRMTRARRDGCDRAKMTGLTPRKSADNKARGHACGNRCITRPATPRTRRACHRGHHCQRFTQEITLECVGIA